MKLNEQNHTRPAKSKRAAARAARWRRLCGPLPLALWQDLAGYAQANEAERLALHLVSFSAGAGQAVDMATLASILAELGGAADEARALLSKRGYSGANVEQPIEELRELASLERRVLRVIERVAAAPKQCRGIMCGAMATTVNSADHAVCATCAAAETPEMRQLVAELRGLT